MLFSWLRGFVKVIFSFPLVLYRGCLRNVFLIQPHTNLSCFVQYHFGDSFFLVSCLPFPFCTIPSGHHFGAEKKKNCRIRDAVIKQISLHEGENLEVFSETNFLRKSSRVIQSRDEIFSFFLFGASKRRDAR